MKICLVTSAGGHFFQVFQLKKVWAPHERFWVTFNKSDITSTIPKEKKYYAYYPESRNIINAVRNFFLAIAILRKEKPTTMISAGAGIAVPFFVIAKILRINTVYLEPLDFIAFPTITGKMIYHLHLANLFLIQNTDQKAFYPKATYWGSVI